MEVRTPRTFDRFLQDVKNDDPSILFARNIVCIYDGKFVKAFTASPTEDHAEVISKQELSDFSIRPLMQFNAEVINYLSQMKGE